MSRREYPSASVLTIGMPIKGRERHFPDARRSKYNMNPQTMLIIACPLGLPWSLGQYYPYILILGSSQYGRGSKYAIFKILCTKVAATLPVT